MPTDWLAALVAEAERSPRAAQTLLRAITRDVTGDPTVVAWLRLFVGVAIKEAA